MQVVLVVPSCTEIKPSDTVVHKIYQVPYKPDFAEDTLVRLELEGKKLQMLFAFSGALTTLCENSLKRTDLLEELRDFDLIIYDNAAYCGALLGELLDVPRVEIMPLPPTTQPFSLYHMIPMPVSYVPQGFTGFSDKMTFVERAMNLAAFFGWRLFDLLVCGREMNALKIKYNIKPERSFQEAVGSAELVLITADFALEYAQPLLPGRMK